MAIEVEIPAKLYPLFEPMRYKVLHGGRGGGKSHTIAKVLLAKGTQQRQRFLCTREVQKSIKESVHKLLSDQIELMGLGEFYDVQATTIKGANGTEFLFAGLQDHTIDSLKSYEGVDVAWVEEAHGVSTRSWEVLTPTIRKAGSEIWASFNPNLEDDEVYQRFIVDPPPDAWVQQVNWSDNPWFPEVLKAERDRLRVQNPDLYAHVWEGKCRSLAGLMFKREWFQHYDKLPDKLNLYVASDYAVTPDGGDYTEHGVWGMDAKGDLYAVDWWSGQADPDEWINAWLALLQQHKPMAAFEEKGVILRAVDSAITKRMRETQTFVRRVPLPSASGKAARALGFAARASAGTVHLPRNTPWAARLLNQLCSFHGEGDQVDDMVDVCSLVGRGLDDMANAARPPAPKTAPRRRDYGFGDPGTDNWKTA